jgi:hypothetical protein
VIWPPRDAKGQSASNAPASAPESEEIMLDSSPLGVAVDDEIPF